VRTAIHVAAWLAAGALCSCERPAELGGRSDAPRLDNGATTVANGTHRNERPTPRPTATPIPLPTRTAYANRPDDEAPTPASGGRSSGMQELERSIESWRARCQPLQASVEAHERSLADREAYAERALESWPRGEIRSKHEERYRQAIEQAREDLQRARDALSACEDGARRDGVSPTHLD
jgi:hypothetical protein